MKKNSFNKLVVVASALSMFPIAGLHAEEPAPNPPDSSKTQTKEKRRPGKVTSGFSKSSVSGGGSSSSTDGTNSASIQTKLTEEKDIKPSLIKTVSSGAECVIDPEKSAAFPMDFFKLLTRDGGLPSVEARDGNKVVVKFPAILSVSGCGDFKPEPYQDPTTKNVTVQFVNTAGKTYGEYLDCLYEKDVLGEDGKIVLDSKNSGFKEYSYAFDYNFDAKEDLKKSLKLSVAYPKAFSGKDGYSPVYGKDLSVELPSKLCEEAEKISPEITYLNKGRDALIEELRAKCYSGDAQKIAEARKSIGNAEALKDIADTLKSKLDAAYLSAVQTDVDEIFKKMGKLEDEFKRTAKDMDEQTAKKKVQAYADLAKQLDDKYLNYAIYRLDNLTKQYEGMEDGDAKKKVGEEIAKLNEDISKFAKRDSVAFVSLYALMEKFALNDQAKTIEDIRLKSYLYSKVYPKGSGSESDKRGKALSFAEANQKQVKGMNNFDRTLTDWSDVYLTSQGNMAPIKKVESARSQVISKMNTRWNTYQQTEYKNYAQYCSTGMTGAVTNPVQCKTFLAGVEKRRQAELKRRDKDLAYIKTTDTKLSKMGVAYNKYQADQVEKATNNDDDTPYGSSYSGYETTFDEKYPQYTGPSESTSYDASMYSMAGATGAQGSFYPMTQYSTGYAANGGLSGQYAYGNNGGYQYQNQMPQMMTYQGGNNAYGSFGYMR